MIMNTRFEWRPPHAAITDLSYPARARLDRRADPGFRDYHRSRSRRRRLSPTATIRLCCGAWHRVVRCGGHRFPEARIFIDNTGLLREVNYGATISWLSLASFPEAEWHHVAMTWQEYPEGSVSIFLDGEFMSQKRYGPQFDDGRSMFESFAVGFRPADWIGEIISLPTGEETMLVPRTEMSIEDGGIVIRDLRIYPRALTNEELRRAYVRSITLPTDEPTSPPPEPLPNQRATEIRSSIR